MKKIALFLLIITFGCSSKGQDKIQFYLLENKAEFTNGRFSGEFKVDKNNLKKNPIISNSDIISYNQNTSELVLTKECSVRLSKLKPKPKEGIQFAMLVNDKIILTGYFWDAFSSFWSEWYTIHLTQGVNEKVKIYKTFPLEFSEDKNIKEVSDYKLFIDALKNSKRLIKE